MTDLIDTRQHSVQRHDLIDGGGVVRMNFWSWGEPWIAQPLPAMLPAYAPLTTGHGGDLVLTRTPDAEAMWAGAISIAASQVAARAWEVEGDAPRLTERAQNLLLNADGGAGWGVFLSKVVQDFATADNGAWIELARAGRGPGARITGLYHLDTQHCYPTGNPKTPMEYQAADGRRYPIPAYNLIRLVDLPSPRREHGGAGRCAARRAYTAIIKLAAMDAYIYSKVTGARPNEIHIVSGVTDKQFAQALADGKTEHDARQANQRATSYQGVLLMGMLGDDKPASGYRIQIAGLPDGFNRKEELDIALLAYANALGLDPQDLQPLTGQALGTGAQSQVLAEKAKGRGMRALEQQLIHALNRMVLPDAVKMVFVERDLSDEARRADIDTKRAGLISQLVADGQLTADQGKAMLADWDIIPRIFVPEDTTPSTTIADTDKPDAEDGEPEDQAAASADMATLKAAQALIADVLQETE